MRTERLHVNCTQFRHSAQHSKDAVVLSTKQIDDRVFHQQYQGRAHFALLQQVYDYKFNPGLISNFLKSKFVIVIC